MMDLLDFPMFDFEVESVWTLTRCGLCSQQLKDPRILPCLHSFCLDCLYTHQSGYSPFQEPDEDIQSGFFNAIVHRMKATKSPVSHKRVVRSMEVTIKEEGDVTCPTCQKEVNLGKEGLEGLARNVFLEKMLEVQRITAGENKAADCTVRCDVCGGMTDISDVESNAVTFCADCTQNLCQRCSNYHRILKGTTTHRLMNIGSEQELVKRLEVLKCPKHSSEKVDVYCKTCQVALCQKCFSSSDHSNHSGCGVVEASNKLKGVIEESIDDFSYDISTIRKHLREVEEVSERFTSNIEYIENALQTKEDEIRAVLCRHAASLRSEVDDKKNSFQKEIKKIRDGLMKHQKMLEDYSSYTKTMLQKASDAVIVTSSPEINKRLKELKKIRLSELTSEIEPTFVPSKIATEAVLGRKMSFCGGVGAASIRNKLSTEGGVSHEDNLIGFLEFKTKYSKKKAGSLAMAKTPILLSARTFNEWTTCMAVACDDDERFLMLGTYSSDEIAFLSTTNTNDAGCRKRKNSMVSDESFRVDGLKNAYSMSVLQDFLFISEWNCDLLHRIGLKDTTQRRYTKLSLSTNEGLNALSTTIDNKFLIVTCAEYDCVKFYNVDGVLKRSIPLDPSVDKPCDCIQLNDDEVKDIYVISQNDGNTSAATSIREESERWAVSHSGDHMDRVLIMDGSGKILYKYGGLKGGSGGSSGGRRMSIHQQYQPSQHQQLNGPYRIFADLIHNLLFVSDHYNHRILLLNSLNLKPIRELIPPTFGLSYPLDIFYDAQQQLLHIADLDNKRFIMFNFE